ncbi:MAG TPA: pentapeptide repeat-containing protein [Cyclobacteriaceae bacterium]|nr:pentapeptide repeat-containing protein [Cyclobacteriaceae bacterium]
MTDSKQDLTDRWTTTEGQLLLTTIVDFLSRKRPLDDITAIQKIDHRFDLRGISLPKEYADYDYKGKQMHQVVGSLKFKNTRIENIDLSHADIQHTEWKNCLFKNVKFHSAQMEQVTVRNCDFEDVEFFNTRLSYSHLNIRTGKKSGSFKNVTFKKSKLNETRFSFPTIEDCNFEDCNLYATDFDGSRFKNCKFIGEVNSPWFRRHSIREFEPNYLLNQVEKTKFTNEMDNVDFSAATLKYVTFSKDLDLTKCKFGDRIKFAPSLAGDKDIYAMTD